jgi:hypothetical protein
MLLNGVHLLPEPSGALIWPKENLLAVSDPVAGTGREAAGRATEAVRRMAALVRTRRPATVLWLGSGLARVLAGDGLDKRCRDELTRIMAEAEWLWVADELPDGLPARAETEFGRGPLTFRQSPGQRSTTGEVCAAPWPLATFQGATLPCYVIDGRRLVLPPLRPRADDAPRGTNVLSPGFLALFRRPFNCLMLTGGAVRTVPRARLEHPSP